MVLLSKLSKIAINLVFTVGPMSQATPQHASSAPVSQPTLHRLAQACMSQPLVWSISGLLVLSQLTGCASTPSRGVTNQTAKQTVAPPRPLNARSGYNNGKLDTSSIDELENLLEATDMMPVESSRAELARYGDLWERLRKGMRMRSDTLSNGRVAAQRNWFASRQTYLDRLTARASRYLYHTVTEAERRGLPTELALLPVIESSYDPGATSNAAAAGLWQFIPSTGEIYGLNQTSTYDGRRDVVESTRAAYDFLTSLYEKFGSWELALAAYNAGPGRIQQAINRNAAQGLPTDYWSLSLPQETMNYVPRFMAVAQIVSRPSDYGVYFNGIANRPHFKSVPVQYGVDMARIASITGLSMDELYALNPAQRNGYISPDSPGQLLLPQSIPASIEQQVRQLSGSGGGGYGYSGGSWQASSTTSERSLSVSRSAPPPLAPLTNAQAAALMGTSASVAYNASAPSLNRAEPPVNAAERQIAAQNARFDGGSVGNGYTGYNPPPALTINENRTAPGPIVTPPTAASVVRPISPTVTAPPATITTATSVSPSSPTTTASAPALPATTSTAASSVAPTVITPADVPRASSGEPLVSSEERQAILSEVASLAPANTPIVNPANGRVQLAAIPTQQTVLAKTGEAREVTYERPSPASRPAPAPARPQGKRTVYTVKPGDSLTGVARLYDVSVQQLAEWNQMSPTASLLTGNSLYLYGVKEPRPVAKAAERVTSYVVQAGDTLTALAARFGMTLQQLASYNDMSPLSDIQTGTRLSLVPGNNKPAARSTATPARSAENRPKTPTAGYRVKPGETLTLLAARMGMSLSDLAELNDFEVTERIQADSILKVPSSKLVQLNSASRRNADDEEDNAASKASRTKRPTTYVVKTGDSLLGIAGRFGLTLSELARYNEVSANYLVKLGETLKIPPADKDSR